VRWMKLFRKPQCVSEPPQGEPQCGNAGRPEPHGGPQCAKTPGKLREEALDAIEEAWQQAPQCNGDPWARDARALAVVFHQAVQAQPVLIGCRISSDWVRAAYPSLCGSQGLRDPPSFPAFAQELARLMPRTRRDDRVKGKRVTRTWYAVEDPGATVVAIGKRA
jgi:hypothetical protein